MGSALTFSKSENIVWLHFSGDLVLENIQKYRKIIERSLPKSEQYSIDIENIHAFDTHGMIFLIDLQNNLQSKGFTVTRGLGSESFEKLYDMCEDNFVWEIENQKRSFGFLDFFYNLGKITSDAKDTFINFLSFGGGVTQAFVDSILAPKKIRFRSILHHMEKSGVNAVPIIIITSFLIGVVVAFQGAVQLEKFGANIFIVEMVTISVSRELAPLLTAIVIAGRSASSFTAQIGVMKITEEIDAMKTMGFSIWHFLIMPRVYALFIILPLLVFLADIIAILGGAIVASAELGISFQEFAQRMQESVAIKHIVIGLLKAPIFGVIIAIIGCFRGFQVDANTESIGKYTTVSVVNAIFWVIAMDAVISVFLTELGL